MLIVAQSQVRKAVYFGRQIASDVGEVSKWLLRWRQPVHATAYRARYETARIESALINLKVICKSIWWFICWQMGEIPMWVWLSLFGLFSRPNRFSSLFPPPRHTERKRLCNCFSPSLPLLLARRTATSCVAALAERILYNLYTKHICCAIFLLLYSAKKLPKSVNIKGVFAANELDLDEVNVYGFDYDYTWVKVKRVWFVAPHSPACVCLPSLFTLTKTCEISSSTVDILTERLTD